MELPSFIDEEVITNPFYWMLTAGAELALLIGFKLQGSWSADIAMPFYSKLLTLILVPVACYFVTWKVTN